jgi:hypothetical protein
VPRKKSEQLWKRFRAACDEFFAERDKHAKPENDFYGNLKAKQRLIEEIKAYESTGDSAADREALRAFQTRWQEIGFVPFKEKDNVYKEYKQATNALYEALHVNANERKLANFRNNIAKGGNSLQREREHLIRQYEAMKNEIATYENNIGFLSVSNKKGASLVDVMKQKVNKLKQDAQVILEKIHLVEDEIEKNAK